MSKEEPFVTDVAELYPEGYAFNLSDFALFLSVMKNKTIPEMTMWQSVPDIIRDCLTVHC